MLAGKTTDAAMKSRNCSRVGTPGAFLCSDGLKLLPKMSFITEYPKYAVCTNCKTIKISLMSN